jgi:hypothetical protein
MSPARLPWEGLILTFVMICSVLIGVSYVISINFRVPIPWLAIVVIAVVGTAGAYRLKLRRVGRDSR